MRDNTMLLWICLIILTSYCNGLPKPDVSRKYGANVANDYTNQNAGTGGYDPGQQSPEGNTVGQTVQDTGLTPMNIGGHEMWDSPFGGEPVDPTNVINLGSVDSDSVASIPNDAVEMPSSIGGIMEQFVPSEFTNSGTYANDPVGSSSQTNQGGGNNPHQVIEPSNYQQAVDTPKKPKVNDNSFFDITTSNFKNGHHKIDSLLADHGAVLSLPYEDNAKQSLPETPIQPDSYTSNTVHDKSPNAHTVDKSATAKTDNHNHEHLNRGMIRDPKTGEITHIVDPHDGTILPVQHHEYLGRHAIDPHNHELLLALETESFLPTSAPGGSNQEPHVPTNQNTGQVLDSSHASSSSFQNHLETLHTHEGAGQSFSNDQHNNHRNEKPFVDSGYGQPEVLPDSLPQHISGTDSYDGAASNTGTALGELPQESYGQSANLPMIGGGVDNTDNTASYKKPVPEIQSKSSYGQDTGLHPGDAAGSDYSNNASPITDGPIIEPIPEHLHAHGQDALSNNKGSDYSGQTGTNYEAIGDLPPMGTSEQHPFLMEPALNPPVDGSYTEESIPATGIDNSFIGKIASNIEKIPGPIPKTTYGQTPELSHKQPDLEPLPKEVYGGQSPLVDIKGSGYGSDPTSETNMGLDLLPIEPFEHDMGATLDIKLPGDYTGNVGSNMEPILEPIPKASYDQGSKTMTADNVGDYTSKTGVDPHQIIDAVPVNSYEQNPVDPLPPQNFGKDYSGSVQSGVLPAVEPLPEEPYTERQNSYSPDKRRKSYSPEESYNAKPVPVYGKDSNLPSELNANSDYSNSKVLDIAPVGHQLPKKTYGENTNSGIIDHTGNLPSSIRAILEELSGGSSRLNPDSHTKNDIGGYGQTSNTEPIVETVPVSDYTPSIDTNTEPKFDLPLLGSYEQDLNLIPSELSSDYASSESNPVLDVLPDGIDPNLIPTEFGNDYANPDSSPVGDVLPDGPYIQDSIPIPQPLKSYEQKAKPQPIHKTDRTYSGNVKRLAEQVVDPLPLESYGENIPPPAIDKVNVGYTGDMDPILEPKRTYGQGRPDSGIASKRPGGIAVHPELLLQDKGDKMYADGSAVSGDIAMLPHDTPSGYEDSASMKPGGLIDKLLPNPEESYLSRTGETGEGRSVKPVSGKYTRGGSITRTKPSRGSKPAKRRSSSYGSRLLQKVKRGSRILKKYARKGARKITNARRRRRKLRAQRRKKKQLLRKKQQERRRKRILAAKAKRQRAARQKTKATQRRRKTSRRRNSRTQTKETDSRRTYANTRRRYRNRRQRRSYRDDDDDRDDD